MMHFQNDRNQLLEFLEQLDSQKEPNFGSMTPQHMLEHLCLATSISNSQVQVELTVTPERAARSKQFMINTDRTFPRGIKVTNPDGSLPDFKFPTIEAAKDALRKHIADFDAFFEENPDAAPVHPVLGPLTHDEWIIFHSKHFTHHFEQFR
jgi:uncharacterized damage-inducible protein DinB